MQQLSKFAIIAALVLSPMTALAQTVPPTTVNAPQSSNNGVSNPVGQNTNVQVNNSYAGMNSFGVGIECATPYLAAGLFNNNTTVGSGTGGVGSSGNNSIGATVQYVVPVGGRQQSNCTALSNEIVHQHQLDTQITLIQRCADFAKAGIKLDAKIYPEIAAACDGVRVSATTASVTPLPMAPVAVVQPKITVPKLVVYREPAPTARMCRPTQSLSDRDRRLARGLKNILNRQHVSRYAASIAAQQLRELQSSCLTPVALANLLGGR